MTDANEPKAALNEDQELYREPGDWRGDFYSDSIHVTKDGAIGINCGGYVVVRPLRFFHAAPDLYEALEPFVAAFRAARERYARRHGQALSLGRERFDRMPGEWPMDTLVFTMEDFRHAEAALAKAVPNVSPQVTGAQDDTL